MGTKSAYDNASRITSITDSTTSAYTWSSLGYDVLDRLNSAVEGSLNIKWTYDANGNRLSQQYSSSSTFNISSTSNQITSTTGSLVRTYAYDAAGNPTSYGTSVLAYNDRGRLASDTVGGTSSTLVYNALGQMIEYTFGSTSTVLVYDEAGHILGEYNPSGTLMREYIWMGDIPVAEIVPSGSSVAVYYIHTDQLNAPRKITLPSTNALAWRWDPHPFGEQTPNQNPSGLGTFINNLRFPGQFYTYESGLNHNGFRDYDPQTGKYLESDPIGLGGGVNTYAYAAGNPVSNKDPLGLLVTIQARNPADQAALQSALDELKTTPAGYAMWQQLDLSPMIYTIGDWKLNADERQPMAPRVNVDPNFHPDATTSCGQQPIPTTVALAHELGHLLRGDNWLDYAKEWNNVVQYENPARQQLGLPLRTAYP